MGATDERTNKDQTVGPILTSVERGVPFGDGKHLDLYRRRDLDHAPVVLLWHGRGPNERDVLAPLASAIAREGFVVFVSDWQSDGQDDGRNDLLASLSYALDRASLAGGDKDRIIVAGWSLGANAAADLMLHPEEADGWTPAGFAGFAGSYDESPISGLPFVGASGTIPVAMPIPCLVVHGSNDTVVPVQRSRDFALQLAATGWPISTLEPETDHAGVIGTEYDANVGRCFSSREPGAVVAMQAVARRLTALWSGS